jgi:hypothetical protein
VAAEGWAEHPAGGDVPQPHGLVGAGGRERLAVGAKRHGVDLAAVAAEGSADGPASGDVPQSHGFVGERMTVEERLGEIERRYGRTSVVVRALEAASDALFAMVRRTEERFALLPAGLPD